MAVGRRNRPTVDDVRTAFYRQANDRTWIREVSLDPLELIVASDSDGTTMRVPVTVSASGAITFGPPVRVRVEYVPADTSSVDASKLVYASAADSRAGNGTHVYATISSSKTGAGMGHAGQGSPTGPRGDRPRRPTEDPVSWALATGRIGPEREDFWRRHVTASAQAATNVLECLAPGTAVPLTAAGRPDSVAAAVPARPAGADPRLYAANPLIDDLRSLPGSTMYASAARFAGDAPTLFAEGDLPHATASGLPPRTLASLPWYGRHPVAAAATAAESEDLIDDLSAPDHLASDYRDHEGNRDYEQRVRDWCMAGGHAAAHHRQVDAAAHLQVLQVAASVSDMTEEEREDLLDDPRDGLAHLERLRSIAGGNAVGSGLTQTEARVELEAFARGEVRSGPYGRVPASAAQAEIARLDKQLGHVAATAQITAAAAAREGRQ